MEDISVTKTFTKEETDRAVTARTESIISNSLAKHGIARSSLTLGQLEDARLTAVADVAREQALQSNPLYEPLKAAKEQLAVQAAQMEAIKQGRANISDTSQPVLTVDAMRRKLGDAAWLHSMTDRARLAAIGVQPDSVTAAVKEEIKTLFGKNPSAHAASDAFKTNPKRYRQLKEIGVCLDLIGK